MKAYIAGVLHGDGWCTRLTLGLRAKDRDFVEAFSEAVNAVFGTSMRAKEDERGYWLARIGNKTGRFNDAKSYVPANNKESAAWLRGLFDSEGNAQCLHLPKHGPNSYHRRIAMFSTDRATLENASEMLDLLGIAHGIYSTKNSATHIGTKPVFELRLLRREAFQAFVANVGSSIGRKQEAMKRIVETFQPAGWQARNWTKAVVARYPHLANVGSK